MTNHEVDNLMIKIAHGDMTALETLYRGMSKPVYFYALRLVGNPDMAEDIMQDTFVSVMRSSASYNSEGKGTSWIFTIAKNRITDLYRKDKGELSFDEIGDIPAALSPQDRTDTRLTALNLLDSLNKKERDIVMLRLFSDMTLTQVSEELGLPKGTVFWTYNNAIRKLRKIYAGGDTDEK